MNNTNPMFAKFDQVLGKTTPTTTNGPVQSRADEIRNLAKTSAPQEDPNKIGTVQSFARGLASPFGNVAANLSVAGHEAESIVQGAMGNKDKSSSLHQQAQDIKQNGIGDPNSYLGNFKGDKGPLDPGASVVEPIKTGLELAPNFIGGEAINAVGGKVLKGALNLGEDALKGTASAIGKGASKAVNFVKPSLLPEEAVGKIIQGSTEDIAPASRALKELDTTGVKTYKDLSTKIDKEIPKIAKQVDSEFAKDTTGGHSIKSFEQTVGEGKSTVKTNYVKTAINDLKSYYKKIGDAQGQSKMKALENNARIKGLTYKDVNELARLHGQEIKAFNANGEAATGLTKQAAEITRMGLKNTARQGLGGEAAKALDAKLTDLYKTKDLIQNMVEKVNTLSNKTVKPSGYSKAVGMGVKAIDTITGHPLKTIGKAMGNVGSGGALSPAELEAELATYLKAIKGK